MRDPAELVADFERRNPIYRQLREALTSLPGDYRPWGQVERWAEAGQAYPDCSMGCRWYVPVEGMAGANYGVCTNPASHRRGLLTFEHQGCQQFELDPEDEDEE